ncbi:DUF2513 domain-containing protein [Pseudomonas capeferrum]|uniref:DUF2513 domain-containing protein n=1 Tax=Pseudomonas capeferrum TaxID=1495066 RepID=UPI0015E30D25|nr:DUF2513 domain-containing protein [Pseudomonas capeferrum]MBA1200365.1 DUF2513 domain-containing protein [Pseudomonas capeferrum]
MKRDWDLVRKILTDVEALPDLDSTLRPEDVQGFRQDEVSYHLYMLQQAGFLESTVTDYMGEGVYCIARQLTWEGQELLSKLREEGG